MNVTSWRMAPRLRKVMLAVHLTTSVGWMGAIVAYLVVDLTVSNSSDPQTIRWGWRAMGLVVSGAIVPLAALALITGLIMALGTPWGLLRYWWILISFVLTLIAAIVLLQEADGIVRLAELAANAATPDSAFRSMRGTLPHSIGGFVVLFVVQILNVLKPQGLTPYGWRIQQQDRLRRQAGRLDPAKEVA